MRIVPVLALTLMPLTAMAADLEISVYGGTQSAHDSTVSGDDDGTPFSFTASWDGKSFSAPPYYGIRATWWQPSGWGFGMELNHAKVYATDDTLDDSGFDRLEFTDGLNLVTLNALRRFDIGGRITPYVGIGAGISVPHVEVDTPSGGSTFEYQVTGPAVIVIAGASLPVSDRWSVFTEYKGSRSWNDADLEGGGSLQTDITTHALNLGVSFNF